MKIAYETFGTACSPMGARDNEYKNTQTEHSTIRPVPVPEVIVAQPRPPMARSITAIAAPAYKTRKAATDSFDKVEGEHDTADQDDLDDYRRGKCVGEAGLSVRGCQILHLKLK